MCRARDLRDALLLHRPQINVVEAEAARAVLDNQILDEVPGCAVACGGVGRDAWRGGPVHCVQVHRITFL